MKGPSGKTVIERTKVVDEEISVSSEPPYFYIPVNLTFPQDSPNGKYTVTIFVTDALGKGSITRKEEFYLNQES